METTIGIDLGTTYSGAAYVSPEGPRMIPNALGATLTPSVVGIDLDGTLLVGEAAKELQVIHPERCASTFKRHMGSDWTVRLVDREFSPEVLSSLVLRSIKQDAEAHFGCDVNAAVITVPAFFNELQRRATMEAGRLAGLRVDRIINEPTAAAIAYGLHESRQEKIALVFDLGGGTFDVSLVEMFEGIVEVRSSSGDSFLGGEDFTAAMAARILESRGHVLERAEAEFPHMTARLLQQCELAKRCLSSREEAKIRIPDHEGNLPEGAPQITVLRRDYEKWVSHVLARLEMPLRRALADARLQPADLNEVILVGGATRMPAVVRWLVERLGKEPQCRLNSDEAVALGAAVQAALIQRAEGLNDLVVTDVCPFTLGVAVTKNFAGKVHPGYFSPIIHRNTPIPTSRVESFSTLRSNQATIQVEVYQGEHRRVENNVLLGKFEVTGIPQGPPGKTVDIRFTYDLNGILEVEAKVLETGKKTTHIITRHSREMTAEQIAQAVAEMASLKQHPREEAENRLLLRRAERMYGELPVASQRYLTTLLDGFEEALQSGDVQSIQSHREAIVEFLSQHESWGDADKDV